MGMCPVCNNFREVHPNCPSCHKQMNDSGRVMDFYDDYSPYMPIDQLKLEDGYPESYANEECRHLFTCETCGYDTVMVIKE